MEREARSFARSIRANCPNARVCEPRVGAPRSAWQFRFVRIALVPRILSAATIAIVVSALAACGSDAPSATCRASFVVDQAAWVANDYGGPDWYTPDPSDPDYYPYTDESGDPVTDDPSSSDPSQDPATSDPATSDPGTSDPGASDPGASDPSGDDTSTASLRAGQPPATIQLRPGATPAPIDANGCYRCALACDLATTPFTTMMASGASDTSVPDACLRARRAIEAWAAHTGSRLATCKPE